MRLTLSTSTANWITDRQLRSVCTTTLAMLRWTNTSPGAMSMIWLAGTRESEQPIHRYSGACCCERRSKKPGSSALTRSDHSLLRSSNSSRVMEEPGLAAPFTSEPSEFESLALMQHSSQMKTDVLGVGEETHRLGAAFAAEAGRAGAAERRAQVALQPSVDPDHADVEPRGQAVG